MRHLAITLVSVAVVTVAWVSSGAQQPSGYDLFQQALAKERVHGQIEEAIQIYERILKEFAADRALVAKALLQMGRCYERLGKGAPDRVYERVVREYGDQRAAADEARARLAILRGPNRAPVDGGVLTFPRARRLWEGQSAGQFLGSPSPDGRYISFVDWNTLELALWEVASGAQRPLTANLAQVGSPYWSRISPDGTEVAFTVFTAGFAGDLRIVRLDNSAMRLLYHNDQVVYVQPFDWSPDGQRLLIVLAMPDGTHRIAIISIADGSVRILKTLDWRQPITMNFSPDGRWIVYDLPQQDSGPERDLFLLAADGTRETPIVTHPADDFLLGWTPDKQTVLFASDRTGTPGAWAIQVTEGKPVGPPRFVRGDLGWRVHPMGFSRAGALFYFIENTISNVYTAMLDPPSGQVADTISAVGGRYAGTYQSADWSPDGRQLALVVDRTGLPDRRLMVWSTERGEARELRPDLAMFTWPRWAPDGQSILVSGRDRKNRKGFFRIDATTGNATELLREQPGTSLILRAEWAPDGHSLFYVRKDSLCSCIFERDLASNHDTEIARMAPSGTLILVAPSPDGRWLALSANEGGRPLLKTIPVGGGEGRVLAEGGTLRWFDFVTWTPDAREVLFGRQTGRGEQVEVWRLPATGGEPRRTELVMDTLRDLRMHPDGRRVVFASGHNKGELWVMENFLPPSATKSSAEKRD